MMAGRMMVGKTVWQLNEMSVWRARVLENCRIAEFEDGIERGIVKRLN